jgi:transposase
LAQIAASKYADHLPLHRLERILARHGVELSGQTMCGWMAHVATMLRPVVDLLAALVRESKALHTDATRMPYLDPDVKGKALSGQMWTYVGDRDHPFDVFAFCPDHGAAGIDAFLGNYRGYLNADAHNIYDHLFRSGAIVELGCWTHARRKFHDAKDSDPARAHVVMAHIRRLYAIEAEAREHSAARQLEPSATGCSRAALKAPKPRRRSSASRRVVTGTVKICSRTCATSCNAWRTTQHRHLSSFATGSPTAGSRRRPTLRDRSS